MKQEQQRHRMTREALADVEAGNVIEHEVILRWADSLDRAGKDVVTKERRFPAKAGIQDDR